MKTIDLHGTIIDVGLGDQKIARSPDVLVTYGLGSCVGICLYDGVHKIAGLAHIVLPHCKKSGAVAQPYRYADTAFPLLLQKMIDAGASTQYLTAKIAGGSRMYATAENAMEHNVGQENVQIVKELLIHFHIPIIADDTRKDCARTLFFSAKDGSVQVKTDTMGEWVL